MTRQIVPLNLRNSWQVDERQAQQHNLNTTSLRQPSTHTSTTTFGSTKGRPIGLFEERRISTLREKKQKLFLLLKMTRRKKVPTSLSDGAGPYISDGYLLVRIPKILIQILLIEK